MSIAAKIRKRSPGGEPEGPSRTVTVQTRLWVSEEVDSLFCRFAERFGRDLRRLRKILDSGISLSKAKLQFGREGLTARHFNSIAVVLRGIRASRTASWERELRQKALRAQAIEKRLLLPPGRGGYAPAVAHQKNRVLGRLRTFLGTARERRPSILFGGRKLWKAQHHLAENGFSSHASWKEAWQEARSSEFFLVGSHDESSGNQSCQLHLSRKTLRVRLPDALGGARLLQDVSFPYGSEVLKEALLRGTALSYRFCRRKKGQWYLFATATVPNAELCTDLSRGAIGVDIGPDRVGVVEVDPQGNPTLRRTYRLPLRRKRSTQARALVQEIAKDLSLVALGTGKPLVLEDLDFDQKKAALKEEGKRRARKLSSFAYRAILQAIHSRSARSGVQVIRVNPAHTSVIGIVKFAAMYGLSGDEAAALALARRAMNLKEVPPARTARGRPEDRPRHVWSRWRQLGEALRQLGRHAFISARRGSGGPRKYPAIPARASPRKEGGRSEGHRSISGGSSRRES